MGLLGASLRVADVVARRDDLSAIGVSLWPSWSRWTVVWAVGHVELTALL